MRQVLSISLILLVFGFASAPVDAQSGYKPATTDFDCPFVEPQDIEVECGRLIVPQDRSQPDGPRVEIAYAVFRSPHPDPFPDPLIYLAGGPGSFTLSVWGGIFDNTFHPFAEDRDVILFDYRGTGESEPTLFCDETVEFVLDTLDDDLSDAEMTDQYYEAFNACRTRLTEDGVDLNQYGGKTLAQDTADLWRALGYDEVNLLGISYGSRLALTIVRDHPEGVRSVIIDGVLPLEINRNATLISNADRAFEELFAACEFDADCAEAYPDLRAMFYETARQLDAEPATVTFRLARDGEEYEARIDGGTFLNTMFQGLYATWLIPTLPATIADTHDGEYGRLSYLVGLFTNNMFSFSDGLYVTQECIEELPFNTIDSVIEAANAYPDLAPLFNSDDFVSEEAYLNNCDGWITAEPDPIDNEPVSSDVPALIFSGQFDPITPPEWGELAAQYLPNSFVYAFPALGHGAITSGEDCPIDMAIQFLEDPYLAPEEFCMADLYAKFETPIKSVTLVRFHDDTQDINGVYPEGWQAIGPTSYASSFAQVNAVHFYHYPYDRREFLTELGNVYGGTLIKSLNPVNAGGKTWTLYRIEATQLTNQVQIATADENNMTFMVVITAGSEDELSVLYEELLLPALALFEIGEEEDQQRA